MLHNWLLDYDGRDAWEEWLEDLDAIDSDGCHQDGNNHAQLSPYKSVGGAFTRSTLRRSEPGAYNEIPHRDGEAGATDNDVENDAPSPTEALAFHKRRKELISHFLVCSASRSLMLGV